MRTYTIKVNADEADKANISGMLLSMLDSLNIGYTIKSEPDSWEKPITRTWAHLGSGFIRGGYTTND